MTRKNASASRILKVKTYLENNYVVVLIWLISVFLSSVITITQGINILTDRYYSTIGHKINSYNLLKKLSPNQDINVFIEILGRPSVVNKLEIIKESDYKEYIFKDKYYYIQAIVNDSGKVISMATTSREKDFKPVFYSPGSPNNIPASRKIVLNSTTFSDISKKTEKSYPNCYAYFGANRFRYFEEYYDGNPGNYQSYFVGVNDAGFTDDFIKNESSGEVWSLSFEKDEIDKGDCSRIPDKFRSSNKINTYVVTSPFISSEIGISENFSFLGVDLNDVRALLN